MKPSNKLHIPKYLKKKSAFSSKQAEDNWLKIKDAIEHIYAENASSLSYQVLYTCCYQISLYKHGAMLYNSVKVTLKQYIQGVREKIMQHHDEVFLKKLLEQWEKHKTAIGMVKDILMYLDRNYVKQHNEKPIYTLGISLFGAEVFTKDTLTRVQRLLMDIIYKDRVGEEAADSFMLKDVVHMMLQISKPQIYVPHFENEFLDKSREFFRAEASDYFENSTATDYLKRVKERMRSERERATLCMDPSTRGKIEKVVMDCMIDDYKSLIIEKPGSGCRVMLDNWRLDELALVYEFLGMVPSALLPCIQMVKSYIHEHGYAIVKDEEKDKNPVDFIEELINLRERSDELLDRSFSHPQSGSQRKVRDKDFTIAVRGAWNDIVNYHDRFPEYLSLYIDRKLRKGKNQINESEFDVLFSQVIALFRHLRDKDIFEKYYKNHLAKRLLGNKSQSDDAEKSFIMKLKTEFGFHFTSKLEGMFSDMKVSREATDKYKLHLSQIAKQPAVDLNMRVLATGFWPLTQFIDVAIPPVILEAKDSFEKFYLGSHSGRKLTWQFNLGEADVRMNGFAKNFELNVSSFQMLILLLFNEHKELTYEQISNSTRIPTKDLKRSLVSLTVKTPVHTRVLSRPKGVKVINTDTLFTANETFKSKKLRIKIAPVILKQDSQALKYTREKIDEERKWQLDAAIVRIMKMRRLLEHRDLILEVTKQLSSRFMPAPDFVKRRIESLIEREYLVREGSAYQYQA